MIFNDFVEYDEWFDDAWNVMIFFFKLYDMLAWMRECMSGICSIFHFFINLRNVGGVMHMHTLWIIDDVWHAMIFFLNLVDAWMHGCMGEFYFIKKDELLMYTWLGMMYEFFFCIFFENNIRIDSHIIVISNSWSHSTLIFFFYFSKSFPWSNQFTNKHFFNHFFETLFEWHAWNCVKGLKRFGWGDED